MSRLNNIALGESSFFFKKVLFKKSAKGMYIYNPYTKTWEKNNKASVEFIHYAFTYTDVTKLELYKLI